ncbi:MAG: hypothetical protein LLG00_04590, partial [Planctomycetaceae bacterium]|nr:hypothetical protein [Planctomycetaceae bacterium]
MEPFRQVLLQIYGLWRTLPSGSRTAVGLLVVAALLGVGHLGTQQSPLPEIDLMHGVPVTVSQLSAMASALTKANLNGYEIRGTSIFVPKGREPAYLAALDAAQALPLGYSDVMHKVLDASNPFESRDQRDQRTKIALQDVLAGMIRQMAGVESAYVIYDVDNRRGPFQERLLTAAVSVKPVGTTQLSEERVSAIRRLVAGAIAGLKPENVTVSDLNGPTWDVQSGVEESLAALKRTYEQELKSKILNALCFIPNVTAEVAVALDPQQVARIRESRPRGNVATEANVATKIGSSPSDVRSGSEASGKEGLASGSCGSAIFSSRVSVGVPTSYLKKIWRERHCETARATTAVPDAAALERIGTEESAKIRRHVCQLLPPTQQAADATEQVAVTTFEDFRTADVPDGISQQALSWLLASWRPLSLL